MKNAKAKGLRLARSIVKKKMRSIKAYRLSQGLDPLSVEDQEALVKVVAYGRGDLKTIAAMLDIVCAKSKGERRSAK